MKKLGTLILSLGLLVTLAGCSQGEKDNTPVKGNEPAKQETSYKLPTPTFENWEEKDPKDGKVYFMWIEDVSYDDVKAYAEELRKCNFTVDEKVDDKYEGKGYRFEASNGTGYKVEFYFEATTVRNTGVAQLEVMPIS